MLQIFFRAALIASFAASLVGCASGGGGGVAMVSPPASPPASPPPTPPPPPPPPPPPAPPSPPTTTLSGPAYFRTLADGFSPTNVDISVATTSSLDTPTLTHNAGSAYSRTFTASERLSAVAIPDVTDLSWRSATDASTLDLISFPGVDAKYIRIAKAYSGVNGAPTSFQAIGPISDRWASGVTPVSGAGIYSGRSYGVLYEGSPFTEHYITTSSISLSVKFASHTMAGEMSDIQSFDAATGAPAPILPVQRMGLQGTISGDSVSGSVNGSYSGAGRYYTSSTTSFSPITGNRTTSNLGGEFVGKFAGETSGEFGGRFKIFTSDFLWSGALIATQTPTIDLTGPDVRSFDDHSTVTDSIANADVAINTSSDLSRAPWLMVSGSDSYRSYEYQYNDTQKRAAPISIPGVVKVTYDTGGVSRNELDWLSFSALNMSYVRIAQAFRNSIGVTYYGDETILAAVSDRWTGASMPLSGSASYNGFTYSTVDFVDASSVRNTYIATAPFNMSANFATLSVAGGATGYSLYDAATGAPTSPAPLAGLGMQFTGQISGDSFSSSNVTTTSGGSGVLSGKFAGPNAAEIGGAYYTGNAQLTVRGAFLAKR